MESNVQQTVLLHMDSSYGNAENVIQDVAGCGPFQVLVVVFVYVFTKLPAMHSLIFMSFGNYHPGWRCLDNVTASPITAGENTTSEVPSSTHDVSPQPDFRLYSCSEFEACNEVEFNFQASTIVTEWSLVCSRSWIPSIIISIQMTGGILGSCAAGQLGDLMGRKKVLYTSVALLGLSNLISIFSFTWQMFAVFRFFIGMFSSSILIVSYALMTEFMTIKTRNTATTVPIWSLSGVLFGVACMILKDWRDLHIMTSVVCAVVFLPVLWVPESLRWLYVKRKSSEFKRVANKMLRLNKKELLPDIEHSSTFGSYIDQDTKRYLFIHLFRKEFRCQTLIIASLWIMISCIYYSVTFGVKSLRGDFYTNLITMFAIIMPCAALTMTLPNIFGRRRTCMLFFGLGSVGLVISLGLELWASEGVKSQGTRVLVMASQLGFNCGWMVISGYTGELYPTVVRSSILGFAVLMARLGSMISPYLVPQNQQSVYIWYATMGALSIVCCVLVSRLPETMSKRLKETFTKRAGTRFLTHRDQHRKHFEHELSSS